MSETHEFLHPQSWKKPKGFANGIVAEGRMVFLAGQIGWNAEQKFDSTDFVAQARQALANIVALVAEAGGKPEHIEIRLRHDEPGGELPGLRDDLRKISRRPSG